MLHRHKNQQFPFTLFINSREIRTRTVTGKNKKQGKRKYLFFSLLKTSFLSHAAYIQKSIFMSIFILLLTERTVLYYSILIVITVSRRWANFFVFGCLTIFFFFNQFLFHFNINCTATQEIQCTQMITIREKVNSNPSSQMKFNIIVLFLFLFVVAMT